MIIAEVRVRMEEIDILTEDLQEAEDRLDRFCKIMLMGRNEASIKFKDLAEVYGRSAVYELIEDTITEYKENR